MKEIKIKIYKFSELSDEAKENALNRLYDINVVHEWWEFTYEDAKEAGIKITSFDIDRASYVKADIDDVHETANLIIKNHGEHCETHKTTKEFLADYDKLVEKYSDGVNKNRVAEDNEYEFDGEADDLEDEFRKSICEDYRIILQKEYDYLTSEEAVIESIEANEYDFTDDGKIY